MVKESVAVTLRRAAMNMLARREHSFGELLDKLTEKYPDFSPLEQIVPALERLREQNLQSDSRFIEAFVRYRSTRGVGPQKILAELYPKKLESDILQHGLYATGIDWYSTCRDVLLKKFKPHGMPDLQERARWQRFLQQRGFDQETVTSVIKSVSKQGYGADDQ